MFDKIRAETDAKIAQQDAEMAQLRAMIADLTEKKKGGRPKKEI
jgi:hypothetical protein